MMRTPIPHKIGCLCKDILHISCLFLYWFKFTRIYLCMNKLFAMGLTRILWCNYPWILVSELERKTLLLCEVYVTYQIMWWKCPFIGKNMMFECMTRVIILLWEGTYKGLVNFCFGFLQREICKHFRQLILAVNYWVHTHKAMKEKVLFSHYVIYLNERMNCIP